MGRRGRRQRLKASGARRRPAKPATPTRTRSKRPTAAKPAIPATFTHVDTRTGQETPIGAPNAVEIFEREVLDAPPSISPGLRRMWTVGL